MTHCFFTGGSGEGERNGLYHGASLSRVRVCRWIHGVFAILSNSFSRAAHYKRSTLPCCFAVFCVVVRAVVTSIAEHLALLVALTSMDDERRAEFHGLIARVRRQELTLLGIYADAQEGKPNVVHVEFRK